jgi:capsular exopolysaccharide synthesis family protein
VSKIRDAMRKSEGEDRESGSARDYSRERPARAPAEGPLGLVPLLPPEMLAYYESVGKQIEVALGSAPTRNIIFTGAVRGEGNSTVISQFAEMLSRRGERVVLVDGNPRHPSLHRHFSVPESPGLAEYISAAAPRDAIIHPTGFANLSLIPLGRCADRSQAERITENLGELVSSLSESYDYVLVDTDYIGSPFFSPSAVGAGDGTVLVIRAGKTNRQVATRACETVRVIGGRILGVVLNRRQFPIPDFIYRRL